MKPTASIENRTTNKEQKSTGNDTRTRSNDKPVILSVKTTPSLHGPPAYLVLMIPALINLLILFRTMGFFMWSWSAAGLV